METANDTDKNASDYKNNTDEKSKSLLNIVNDFVSDLLTTFPELEEGLDPRLVSVRAQDSESVYAIESLNQYFNTVFPKRFFDILYENESMFENMEANLEFLPGIDYRKIWKENITDNTRKSMWKYLQLILFNTVSNVSSSKSFGATAKLFEAINEDEFRQKIEETLAGVQDMFENIGGEKGEKGEDDDNETKSENHRSSFIPDPETFHKHVSSMMDGKLGTLAKEIAEETAQEWNLDITNASNVGDVFKKMLKNPSKLMDMVKCVGGKLDTKIKSGDIKESELLAEASDLMKKMQDTPGLEDIKEMLKKMGLGRGTKVNEGAMRSHLERQMRFAKQKDILKSKAGATSQAHKFKQMSPEEFAARSAEADKATAELLKMDDVKNLVFRSGSGAERSVKRQDNDANNKNKKKANKKKGKK